MAANTTVRSPWLAPVVMLTPVRTRGSAYTCPCTWYCHNFPNVVEFTTDNWNGYLSAVEKAFGYDGVDYAQIKKVFGSVNDPEKSHGRYSPAAVVTKVEELPGTGVLTKLPLTVALIVCTAVPVAAAEIIPPALNRFRPSRHSTCNDR